MEDIVFRKQFLTATDDYYFHSMRYSREEKNIYIRKYYTSKKKIEKNDSTIKKIPPMYYVYFKRLLQ